MTFAFMRGAIAWEAQIGRLCARFYYPRFWSWGLVVRIYWADEENW